MKISWLCLSLLFSSDTAEKKSLAPPPDTKEDAERLRAALLIIDRSVETKELLKAMETLRDAFPRSRDVLVECTEKGSPKSMCFALQVLGEKGEAAKDLKVVVKGLQNPKPKVRLAAVMAIRRLGMDGYKDLIAYLPRETEANNRKMAIKTLQHWNAKEAVPVLVRLLKKEKERSVRNFLVTALEALTDKKLGDDAGAWDEHLDSEATQAQAKALVAPQETPKEASKP